MITDVVNLRELLNNLSDGRQSLIRIKTKINKATGDSELHEKLTKKYIQAKELTDNIRDRQTDLTILLKLNRLEEKNQQGHAEDLICSSVDSYLPIVFPDHKFKSSLECNFKWGNFKAYLELIDEQGNVRMPHIGEGDMYQRVLGLSTILATLRRLGIYRLIMDEPFAPSDNENLERSCEILDEAITQGFQIIMIEHRPQYYSSLKRRLHKWILNKDNNEVQVGYTDLERGE